MTAQAGLAGQLAGFPGQRLEGEGLPRPPDWWRQRESGVFLRKLPAAALAGLGPGGVEIRSGQLLRNLARRRDVVPVGPRAPGFERIYDSRIRQAGGLGPGWRTRWDATLHVRADAVVYHDEWGRVLTLPRPAPGTQIVLASVSLSLACLEDGRFVMADPRSAYRRFLPEDAAGLARLDALEFPDGRRLRGNRDEQGGLRSISDEMGMGLWFDLDDRGRIRAIARGPQAEPCARYAYDDHGLLVSVEQARGRAIGHYRYQDGLLADIVERADAWSVRWQESGLGTGPRVVGLQGPAGKMWLLHRDADGMRLRMQASGGAQLRWRLDEHGRVVEYRDANDAVYRAQHDAASRLTRVDAPDGAFEFEYDDFGRVVRETGPHGWTRRVGYAYATLLPMMLSREGGRNWFWSRDAHLHVRQRRAPGGVITDYEYDSRTGSCLALRQGGVETRFDHDAAGRLCAREVAGGAASRYAWTDAGQLRATAEAGAALEWREADDAGNLRVHRGAGMHARLAVHGPDGNLLSLANATGHARHWRYDPQGCLTMLTDEEGMSTRYTRDASGHDLMVQGPGGGTQRWLRDDRRRVLARRDADDVMSERSFDTSGRVTRVVEASGAARVHTTFAYDGFGRVAWREREGQRSAFTYDAHGRLTALHADADGDADAATSVLEFEYDELGRRVGEIGEDGALLRHLDSLGRLAAQRLPCGLALFTARDGAARAVQLSYALDGDTVTLATLFYDSAGREVRRMMGPIQREITRDEATGVHRETTTRVSGSHAGVNIDGLNRRERWDAAGRLVEEDDGNGRRLYDYDRRGQLVRSIGDAGMLYTTWDSGGNIIALDSAGWAPAAPAPNHRLTRIGSLTLAYDDWGRVLRRDGPMGGVHLTWDAAGRLARAQSNGVTALYIYDAAGRLTGRRIGGLGGGADASFTHRFIWDGLRLAQTITPTRKMAYVYAPARAGWQSHAPVARLIQQRTHAQADWAEPVVQYLYVDAAARVRAVIHADGEIGGHAGVRPWGERIMPMAAGIPEPPGFAGHWVDPDTQLCWNGSRFYDPLTGRYLSPDRSAPPGVSPYRYVAAPGAQANPTGWAVSAQGVAARVGITIPDLAPIAWAGAQPPSACMP